MTTKKQIEANRLNALKSSGPKTLPGKSRSSMNAVRHGLTSSQVVLFDEDPEEYRCLLASCREEFLPGTELQETLVDIYAQSLWRLRRVAVFEAAFLSWIQRSELVKDQRAASIPRIGESATRLRLPTAQSASSNGPGEESYYGLGRAIERALANKDTLNKLSRYEAGLVRTCERALNSLIRVLDQDRRRAKLAKIGRNAIVVKD